MLERDAGAHWEYLLIKGKMLLEIGSAEDTEDVVLKPGRARSVDGRAHPLNAVRGCELVLVSWEKR